MSVRVFDGTDDEVRFPIPADLTGANSIAVAVKRVGTGIYQTMLCHHDSGGVGRLVYDIDSANKLYGWNGSGTIGTTVLDTGWNVGVLTKGAGTVIPRFHIYDFDTAVWVHEAGSLTLPNAATCAGGTLRLGEFQDTEDFNGKLAVVGEWAAELSDPQVEALTTNLRTTDWINHAVTPVWVVEPGQNTPVQDMIGSVDSTTINGTTVDSGDDPAGWTYGSDASDVPGPANDLLRYIDG